MLPLLIKKYPWWKDERVITAVLYAYSLHASEGTMIDPWPAPRNVVPWIFVSDWSFCYIQCYPMLSWLVKLVCTNFKNDYMHLCLLWVFILVVMAGCVAKWTNVTCSNGFPWSETFHIQYNQRESVPVWPEMRKVIKNLYWTSLCTPLMHIYFLLPLLNILCCNKFQAWV